MTSGNNIRKRNHKTESSLIKIRFSGSNVSPIPMRFLYHLVNIRTREVSFNDFQCIEVNFYHFYMGRGWGDRSFDYLRPCALNASMDSAKRRKWRQLSALTTIQVHPPHALWPPLYCIRNISPSLSLQEEALCPGKNDKKTFMLGQLGRHGIRCSELIFFQLLSGK